jgi:hypothetical protein
MLVKNIGSNKMYKSHSKTYKKICDKLPMIRDIKYLANAMTVKGSNIYIMDYVEASSLILKWDYVIRNHNQWIIQDCYKVKDFLEQKNITDSKKLFDNIDINDINNIKTVPLLYQMHKKGIITKLGLGFIYYTNEEQLEKIKEETKNIERNLERSLFHSELYKAYKTIQLIRKYS